MRIDLDLQEMMTNLAKKVVLYSIQEAPEDTGDLRDSIKMSDFDPTDNSIDVFIDPAKIEFNRPNTKRWHGMLYPELVHKGHKTRLKSGGKGKAYIPANPFFEKALEKVNAGDFTGIIFKVVHSEFN